MNKASVVLDENGYPVLVVLADVPNAGVSKTDPNATSGNPRHDVHSGKFGAGGPGQQPQKTPPNTSQLDYARMLDAVRQAARSLKGIDQANIQKFLDRRAIAPDQVDVAQFLRLVMDQRNNDVIDIIDQQFRSGGPIQRGSWVRVSTPRGNLKKLTGSLAPEDVSIVMHRLEAMGHTAKDINKFFAGQIPSEVHQAATKQKPPLPQPVPK